MDRLSIVLTLVTGSILTGGLLIVVLSLGFYSWLPNSVAVALGLFLTWPAAYVISSWINRDDPGWRPKSGAREAKHKSSADFSET